GQQIRVGEVIAYRNLFWSMSEAMARNADPWVNGAVLPNIEAASAYHVFGATFYPIVRNLIEQSVASGLIYLNSSARDFQNPELRPYVDKYIRGSGGHDAESRVKVMKLLWDAIGTEFGARHELYEINYSGSTEENRLTALNLANATGLSARMKGLVDTCLAEYTLDGWTAPDLIGNDDVSWLKKK
ncbi:MAG: 4-hydroxyphenylacetate 3-hydroxylase C-terminal domain-containing protein, partial [Dehalococcoidia bacterium]